MKLRAAALLAAVAFVVAALAWLRSAGDEADAPVEGAVAAAPRQAPEAVAFARSRDPLPPLPDSLEGTREDGALVVDAAGRFVPTPDAIDLFDYYLAATGEEPDESIRARILAAIDARLEGEAAEAAQQLLGDYLLYRVRAAELLTGRRVGEDLERRLQYLRELRREVFGAEVAGALFAEEEARWFADLERRRLLSDPALDPSEREQRLAALEAERPDRLRAAHDAARAHDLLRSEEARLRAEGAGAAEIAQLREQRFGSEAAARLAQLDADRESWEARFEAYRSARQLALAEASPEVRGALIDELRARHFEPSELARVRALDSAAERAGD